jgi:hypothetical protein
MAKTLAELRAEHAKHQAEQENQGGSKGASDYASFNKGSNIVRFLPGKDNPLDFYKEAHLHKYQDDKGNWRSYRCRKSAGEECPVCDLYWDLWKRHKALDLGKDENGRNRRSEFGNLATKIKAKPRFFATAVIRSLQEAGEDPVKYVAMSQQLFDKVMGAILDEDYQDEKNPEETTILSLDRGNDFDIKLTDQGEFVSFSESKAKVKKSVAGTDAEIAEWLENKLDLASLVEVGTYEEGKQIAQMLDASLNSRGNESGSTVKSDSETDEQKFEKDLQA